jgi:MFS family permease
MTGTDPIVADSGATTGAALANPASTPTPAAASAAPSDAPTADPAAAPAAAPMPLPRSFMLLWLGQMVSSFGTSLTTFGLGVWLYQQTGSILNMSLMVLCATLPALLLTPWVGSVADRLDKRRVLIGSDIIALTGIGILTFLLWQQKLVASHLYGVQILLSFGLAFQNPAGQAVVTHMVDKSQFGRAGGLFALSQALAALLGPLLAALLINQLGLLCVLLLDLATFLFSMLCLTMAQFPPLAPALGWSFWRQPLRDMAAAAGFFRRHGSMALIYGYLALAGFLAGVVTVLVQPYALSFLSVSSLGGIISSAGFGALVGGVLMAVTGGPKQWTPLILGFSVLEGLAVISAGYFTNLPVLCLCAFLVMFCNASLQACVLAVWRRKVPLLQQGSVAALQRAIDLSLIPMAALVGGVLGEKVFEPALRTHGAWAHSIGLWFGVGPGRGTGLLFCVIGLLVCLLSLAAMSSRRLRQLEADVPDAF